MREVGILLTILPLSIFAGDNCTAGQGRVTPCGRHTMILVDSTEFMGTKENADQLFNYMVTLLSTYKIDEQNQVYFSLGYYANPYSSENGFERHDAVKTPEALCDGFLSLEAYHENATIGSFTLNRVLNLLEYFNEYQTYRYDHVILFTATTDQLDVDETAKELGLLNASFTVISMGAAADFSSWQNTRIIDVPLQLPFPDYLAEIIINTQCYEAPTPNCPCTPSKSWNDIFLLFDGSNGMAANRFEELLDYVFSAMGQLTIGQGEQFQTRAGIITYGDHVHLFANLDHYTDTDSFVDDIDNVKRTNKDGTNIDGAIGVASDSFKSSAHRSTSQKVMIIGASTYRLGSYESPLAKAKTFKDNGGIIIVIAFGDSNGNVAPELKEIASPAYYIDSRKNIAKVQDLIDLICSANCFCPKAYASDSTTHRGDPNDGCYQTSTLEATNQLAKHYCSREHQGKLSTVVTPAQQIFISKDVTGKEPIYVGLERSHGQWTWVDGTTFSGVINDNGGDCATLTRVKGYKTEFDSVQCISPYLYSCQATPCSTEVFCTQF